MLDVFANTKSHKIPGTGRSAHDALKSDWVRLGGDMRRAADKVMLSGKEQ